MGDQSLIMWAVFAVSYACGICFLYIRLWRVLVVFGRVGVSSEAFELRNAV